MYSYLYYVNLKELSKIAGLTLGIFRILCHISYIYIYSRLGHFSNRDLDSHDGEFYDSVRIYTVILSPPVSSAKVFKGHWPDEKAQHARTCARWDFTIGIQLCMTQPLASRLPLLHWCFRRMLGPQMRFWYALFSRASRVAGTLLYVHTRSIRFFSNSGSQDVFNL